jgi:hypothetical protein
LGGASDLFFEFGIEVLHRRPQIAGRFVPDGPGQVAEVIIKFSGQDIHAKKKKP